MEWIESIAAALLLLIILACIGFNSTDISHEDVWLESDNENFYPNDFCETQDHTKQICRELYLHAVSSNNKYFCNNYCEYFENCENVYNCEWINNVQNHLIKIRVGIDIPEFLYKHNTSIIGGSENE